MKTAEEIRRQNLALLISECDNNQRALADRAKKSPSQVSQWLNASIDSKSKKPRSISKAIARQLEAAMGKPHGWMDQDHSAPHLSGAEGQETTDKHRLLDDLTVVYQAFVEIEKYRVRNSLESFTRKQLEAMLHQVAVRIKDGWEASKEDLCLELQKIIDNAAKHGNSDADDTTDRE